jgi:hypothetical protein
MVVSWFLELIPAQATVHRNHRPGDAAGRAGWRENTPIGNVFGLAVAADRDLVLRPIIGSISASPSWRGR